MGQPYLRNAWYQAAWSQEVTAEEPLVRTILDLPLLFFRGPDGTVSALHDRCPHRFAPLSAGRVRDGIVVCGYHGLTFDASGACVRNPHGPVARTMRVANFPVRERHQAIWIWMGNAQTADPASIPTFRLSTTRPRRRGS